MIIRKIQNNKGFALLFSVMISSIILAIALGVANIALKEIKFSTSGKDTNNAFFAADTGIECALFNDKSTSNVFISPVGSVQCLGVSINPSYLANDPLYFSYPSWNFILSGLGVDGQACARVTVVKTPVPGTILISKGYNLGGDSSCISSSSNRVERQLESYY